jgi:hypothetical protein
VQQGLDSIPSMVKIKKKAEQDDPGLSTPTSDRSTLQDAGFWGTMFPEIWVVMWLRTARGGGCKEGSPPRTLGLQ